MQPAGADHSLKLLNQIRGCELREQDLVPFARGFCFPRTTNKTAFFADHLPPISRRLKFRIALDRVLSRRHVDNQAPDLLGILQNDDYLLAWFAADFYKIPRSGQARARMEDELRLISELKSTELAAFIPPTRFAREPVLHSVSPRSVMLNKSSWQPERVDHLVPEFYRALKRCGLAHGDFHINNILVSSANARLLVIDWDMAEPSQRPFADIVSFYLHLKGFWYGRDYDQALSAFLENPSGAQSSLKAMGLPQMAALWEAEFNPDDIAAYYIQRMRWFARNSHDGHLENRIKEIFRSYEQAG